MENIKSLVILNECFPFDEGESFLENEIPFIKGFDRIYLCPCQVSNFKKKRVIADDKIRIIASKKDKSKVIRILRLAKCFFNPLFWKEIKVLIQNEKLNFRTIKSLLSFLCIGMTCVHKIKGQLRKDGFAKEDSIFFYSYWMFYHAYAAVRLKKQYSNSKAVSRCHRFDLYEYRNTEHYLPFRKYIMENLDAIFSISADGKSYLEHCYPYIRKNIAIARLGTMDHGVKNTNAEKAPFRIVSCSWLSPVKRVWKIVDALSQITDTKIEWTHFGSGQQLEWLKKYAVKKLRPNVRVDFAGAVSNSAVLNLYQQNEYHLFINVSESEGIPVSIMEAMSFGIPAVATDVGGVGEIVIDGKNGILLRKDFSDDDLSGAIIKFSGMDNSQYRIYRNDARRTWEEKYNAAKNYTDFYKTLEADYNTK